MVDCEMMIFHFYFLPHLLAFLHKFKIIHRDLKPENLLMRRDGHLVSEMVDCETDHDDSKFMCCDLSHFFRL